MFDAPEVFANIPDIAYIYKTNDKQIEDLENAVEKMDDNILIDTMHEDMVIRWEKALNLIPLDDDTLSDRRFRIKTKVMEKLPYSWRVLIKKFDILCPDGYEIKISEDRLFLNVKLALKSKKMINNARELCETILPLNMCFEVHIQWNTYGMMKKFTHRELSKLTHKQIREEVFE